MVYGSMDTSCARRKEQSHPRRSPARASSECTVTMSEHKGRENIDAMPYINTEYVATIN